MIGFCVYNEEYISGKFSTHMYFKKNISIILKYDLRLQVFTQ